MNIIQKKRLQEFFIFIKWKANDVVNVNINYNKTIQNPNHLRKPTNLDGDYERFLSWDDGRISEDYIDNAKERFLKGFEFSEKLIPYFYNDKEIIDQKLDEFKDKYSKIINETIEMDELEEKQEQKK